VIDVGANIGFYTGIFAALGKTVLALEPIWFNRLYLKTLVSVNAFADRVTILPFAAGDSEGPATIYGEQAGASMVSGFNNFPTGRSRQINVTTLDTVLRKHDFLRAKRLLFKVDVEGFELSVLQGAREALKMEPKAIWFVEVARVNWEPVIALFAGAGFKVAVMFSEEHYELRRIDDLPAAFPSANLGLGYCNLIFLNDGTLVS
jgi:FkbM family methyltransferase